MEDTRLTVHTQDDGAIQIQELEPRDRGRGRLQFELTAIGDLETGIAYLTVDVADLLMIARACDRAAATP